jgi:hypothetical protein
MPSQILLGQGAQLGRNGGNIIVFGKEAVFDDTQYSGSGGIVIGQNASAGRTDQISIGTLAGSTLNNNGNPAGISTINIGTRSGRNQFGSVNRASYTVAIGYYSAESDQRENAIAIGKNAGELTQGANSIAIGAGAGQTNQGAQSIILNATGANLNGGANSFYVKPIRKVTSATLPAGFSMMAYNTSTGEIIYWGP